jgi:hypothetical protein
MFCFVVDISRKNWETQKNFHREKEILQCCIQRLILRETPFYFVGFRCVR